MNEKENLKKDYNDPNGERKPELIALTECLQVAVNRFDWLTCEVSAKLQNIKRYSELEQKNVERVENQQPESFTEEMYRLICKVEEYNSRLEFNLRHLNEII